MTLYKQISIFITTIFLILFSIILIVIFSIMREYAQKELYENAQNSVSTLSLSISNTQISESNIQTMIDATFDNGNYERITFKNIDNEIMHERKQEEIKINNILKWFEDIIDLEIPVAKSTLSNNWQIVGILEIINDKNTIYLQLYKLMTHILIYLSILCIIFLIVLYYILHLILKPLLNIQKQASAVINNEFLIQEELPKTKEFKIVIKSINSMIRKFESIFQSANESLSKSKELLYMDSVMNIPNRKYFILKASEYMIEESEKSNGITIIISIKRVELLNQIIGYENTDKLMHDFAQYIKIITKKFEDVLLCRLNGTEIIILLPNKDISNISYIIEDIFAYINNILEKYKIENKKDLGIYLGVSKYEKIKEIKTFFNFLDYLVAQAKLLPNGKYYIFNNMNIDIGKNKWRENILNGIKNHNFQIIYRKTIESKTKKNVHNVVSFILKIDSQSYTYSEFMAFVIKLNLVEDVYLYIIEKILLSKNNSTEIITTIQLSSDFLTNIYAYEKLKRLFERLRNQIKGRIVFEISEALINKHYETTLLFVNLFKEYHFGFGINNFIADSQDYSYLKKIKPSFVKVDKEYLLGNVQNINILKIILESLGINLIATGVNSIEELNLLYENNITIITGRVVDDLI